MPIPRRAGNTSKNQMKESWGRMADQARIRPNSMRSLRGALPEFLRWSIVAILEKFLALRNYFVTGGYFRLLFKD
jgi:hypothetical protein